MTRRYLQVIASRWVIVTFLVVGVAGGCKDTLTDPAEARLARDHLNRLLDLMEANSINRKTIDWPEFRSTVLAQAPAPANIGDTFTAIHTALGLLDDNHSSYRAPLGYGVTIQNSQVACTAPATVIPDVPADVGYVRAGAFAGSASQATAYASSLHSQIRGRDVASGVVGWIVDLRGNGGGNMWPMIAGLGPILGEGTVGYFIDPDGFESTWEYRAGVAIVNGMTAQAVANPYTLRSPGPRVAVLIDGRVASSGEAAAIAFVGRPDTRFFGTSTCGLATANSPFAVDGATLVLAVAAMADRNKVVVADTLSPEEVIPQPDLLIQRAIEWLRGT